MIIKYLTASTQIRYENCLYWKTSGIKKGKKNIIPSYNCKKGKLLRNSAENLEYMVSQKYCALEF